MGNILSVTEQPNFGIDSIPIGSQLCTLVTRKKSIDETAKSRPNLERSARIKERRKRKAEREEKEKVKVMKLEEASEPVEALIDDIEDVTADMRELKLKHVATNTDESACLAGRQGAPGQVYDEEYFL